MEENFVDFRAIKQQVSITSVLARYRIQLHKVNQHSLRGKCPLPTHSSEQSKESFGVHLAKNIWACQSTSCVAARQGKKGGNVLDLVAVMESCSIRDAAIKLQDWFLVPSTPAPETKDEPKLVAKRNEQGSGEQKVNTPLSFELKSVDPSHQYLRQRGIREETARTFGAGVFSGRGSMSGRVVVPIHNHEGQLLAYAGRSIDDSEPKYKLPAGFRKSLELFNLHRVGENDRVVVVEGFFDCMKVHQAGFPCVALMGSSLSAEQEEILARTFKRVLLLFDGDAAGSAATDDCLMRLGRRMLVMAVMLPAGKQPDRMSSEELREALHSF